MKIDKFGSIVAIVAIGLLQFGQNLQAAIKEVDKETDDLLQRSLDEAFGSSDLFNLPVSDTFSGDGLNVFDDHFKNVAKGPEKEAIESDIMRQALSLTSENSIAEALSALDQAIAEFPNASYPKIVKALLLGSSGEVRPAVAILESIVQTDDSNIPALSSLVDLYIRLDDHGSAKNTILKLYQLNPDAPQVHIGLGLIADKEGDVTNALKFYRHSLTLAPLNLVANTNLGRLYNLTKQYPQTIALLEDLAKKDLPSASIYTILGVAYLGVNQIEKAISIYDRTQALFPDADLSLNFGVIYRQAKRYEESIESFEQTIANEPGSLSGYTQLAITYAEMQKYQDAISVIQNGINAAGSDDVPIHLLLAEVYEKAGNGDRAEEVVQALVHRNTMEMPEVDRLSQFFLARERIEDAENLWGKAQNIFPENPIVFYRLGQIYRSAGRFQDSLNAFSTASRMAPDDLNFKYEMVLVKRDLEDIDGALDLTREIVADYPERMDFQLILGELFHLSGQDQKSVEIYNRILLSDEKSLVALNNLANRYLDLGQANLAEQNARKAYEIAPENPAILDTLGWILVKNSKNSEGLELLKRAYQSNKYDPSISYHLGKSYHLAGDVEKSKELLQSVVDSGIEFPEKLEAKALLAELAN